MDLISCEESMGKKIFKKNIRREALASRPMKSKSKISDFQRRIVRTNKSEDQVDSLPATKAIRMRPASPGVKGKGTMFHI